MVGAFWRVKNGHHFHGEPAPTDTSDYAAYRAMLAAAPLPSSPSQERCEDLVEASQSLRSVPQSALPDAWRPGSTVEHCVLGSRGVVLDAERGYHVRWRDGSTAFVRESALTSPSTASAAAIPENPENVQGEA
jgi:hypothetical protein